MKHLDVLERAGLVLARRQGRQVWNHLNAVPLREVYERWVGKHESATAAALLRLKRHVEQGSSESLVSPGASRSPPESHEPWFEQHDQSELTEQRTVARPRSAARGSTQRVTLKPTRARGGAAVWLRADAATIWHLLADPSASRAWRSCVRFEEPPREGSACTLILSTLTSPPRDAPEQPHAARVREIVARQCLRVERDDAELAFRLRATPEGTRVEMACASERPEDLIAAMESLARLHAHAERGRAT